jgi:hypothetical protein
VFAQVLWWTEIAVEALLLARAIAAKFYTKYTLFYFYVSSVLLLELFRFAVFTNLPNSYPLFYWRTQLLAAIAGYAVILEMYTQLLKKYRGAVRAANGLLLCILGAVMLKIIAGAVSGSGWSSGDTMAALERDMRALQAALLLVIIALLAYYKIPTGRNLMGIVVGYSCYVGTSVVCVGFGSLPGFAPRPAWRSVQPIAYLATLSIWCFTLWSYHPNPNPGPESKIDRDYKSLSEQTKRILARARSYLKIGGEL